MSINLIEIVLEIVLNPFFIISSIFWIIMLIIIIVFGKKRKGLMYIFIPLFAMVGTKRLNKFLKRVSQWHPKFWRIFWSCGFFVSFFFMIYGIWLIFYNLVSLLISPSIENALIPLVPGLTIDLPTFAYLIIPILFVVTIHEFSHAMAAGSDNINVLSTGVFAGGLFYLLGFGAYCEVDEHTLNSKPSLWKTRLRIAAAGTYSNAIMAGIGILLILNFTGLITPSYGPRVFQIDYVSQPYEGGYNYNNLIEGDVVVAINETLIDVDNGVDLDNILVNKTQIKCSVGDSLNFTIYNANSNSYLYKSVNLGIYNFIGISYENISNGELKINQVYSALQGGNNYDKNLTIGTLITKINGTQVDVSNNITIDYILTQVQPGDYLNLTADSGVSYLLDVDAVPLVPGAFIFENLYMGILYEDLGNNDIHISKVFNNLTESGINEGILKEGDQILEVEGIGIQSNEHSFKNIIDNLTLNPSEPINFKIKRDQEILEINTNTLEIPTKSVKIGIFSNKNYWIPKNFLSIWLSGNFPFYLLRQLLWFFVVSFSVTIFNMLPIPIFDGDRIINEIINKIIGEKYDSIEKKIEEFYYKREKKEYPLNQYRINKINSLKLKSEEGEIIIGLDNYHLIDGTGDGFKDVLALTFPETSKIKEKSIFEVNYEYQFDSKSPIKKKIINSIRLIITLAFLANIILSFMRFGDISSIFNF